MTKLTGKNKQRARAKARVHERAGGKDYTLTGKRRPAGAKMQRRASRGMLDGSKPVTTIYATVQMVARERNRMRIQLRDKMIPVIV